MRRISCLKILNGFNLRLKNVETSTKEEVSDDVGDDEGGGNDGDANEGVGNLFLSFTGFFGVTSAGDVADTGEEELEEEPDASNGSKEIDDGRKEFVDLGGIADDGGGGLDRTNGI